MHFSTIAVSMAFFSLARSAALQSRALSGQATFYGGNLQGGACSFSTYTLPSGVYGTALSDSNWDNAGNCGACISITNLAGKSITAMIVDECPGCGLNHLDLFPDAFAALANPSTGIIPTTWSFVDCPITSPLQLHNKDSGVSAYWFSMQVVNANKAVASLEVSVDGGSSWTGTTRQSYNFFEYSSGFGTTTVDVKVTSIDGDVVVVNNVQVASGVSATAASNFGSTNISPAASSSVMPTQVTAAAAAADTSAVSSSTATSTSNAMLSTTTDVAGIVEPNFTSADEPLPTPTSTPSVSMAAAATTMATVIYTPSTTSVAATVSTVTFYSYEGCS